LAPTALDIRLLSCYNRVGSKREETGGETVGIDVTAARKAYNEAIELARRAYTEALAKARKAKND
jgi:hypothetical protein